jgi:mannosyltransferase OCH1-like enzyme
MGSIPKITHQIWLQGWDKVPSSFHKNIELLSEKNPEYQHMKWDETSLREECNKIDPVIAARFDAYKHLIQKVDFGRYVVLYNYGGISIDTDMKSIGAIDSTPGLTASDFIISESAFPLNIIGCINNALIMVKKQHPILRTILFKMARSFQPESDYLTKELYISYTTGPDFIKQIVRSYPKEIRIINYMYYEPCFSIDPICSPATTTIMDHQHEMSWMNIYIKYVLKCFIVLFYICLFIIPIGIIYFMYNSSFIKKLYKIGQLQFKLL